MAARLKLVSLTRSHTCFSLWHILSIRLTVILASRKAALATAGDTWPPPEKEIAVVTRISYVLPSPSSFGLVACKSADKSRASRRRIGRAITLPRRGRGVAAKRAA